MGCRALVFLGFLGVSGVGCADPCLDDGLGQDRDVSNCAAAGSGASAGTDGGSATAQPSSASASMSATATATATMSGGGTGVDSDSDSDSDSDTDSDSDSDSDTDSDSDSDSDSESGTDTDSDTGTDTTDYCDDADMDGFGDPDACTPVDEGDRPPPGTVDNDLDCDDSDPDTYPGAAQNEADTDACMNDDDDDGWGDDMPPAGVAPGSDCNDDGDSPCALIVTEDGTDDDTYDQGLIGSLEALGYAVTNIADTDAVPTDGDGFDVVVISESALSTDLADVLVDTLAPVVCLEGLVWDDMQMADEGQTTSADDVTILDATSALAGGLSGTVDVLNGPGRGMFHTSPPAAAQRVGRVAGAPGNVVYFAFDLGDAMLDGTIAPARRVGLGFDRDQQTPNNVTITNNGLALFEAAVLWATN